MGMMMQELLAPVSVLAHYLKILIGISLTAALKLERGDADEDQAMVHQQPQQQLQYGAS